MQVTLPFFVLHGEADTVTDPEVSRALYEKASSKDKTMQLYPGMWHGLTSGEPDENIQLVFADIITWLDKRIADEITVQPIDTFKASMVNMISTPSAVTVTEDHQQSKRSQSQSHSRYLCGLKGRSLLSAM